jgi:hypothetical protein
MIKLFSDKHVTYNVDDSRLHDLQATLLFFSSWSEGITSKDQFISDKLWFDLQSMAHRFISMVQTKLRRFPGSIVKPAIVNQDVVENHFSQLRGANGQNDNPTYQITQGMQNAIIYGQTTISRKSNTGITKSHIKIYLGGKRHTQQSKNAVGLLREK